MDRVFAGNPLFVILRIYPFSMVDKSLDFHIFGYIDWVLRRYLCEYRVQATFINWVYGRRLLSDIRKFQDCFVIC